MGNRRSNLVLPSEELSRAVSASGFTEMGRPQESGQSPAKRATNIFFARQFFGGEEI